MFFFELVGGGSILGFGKQGKRSEIQEAVNKSCKFGGNVNSWRGYVVFGQGKKCIFGERK